MRKHLNIVLAAALAFACVLVPTACVSTSAPVAAAPGVDPALGRNLTVARGAVAAAGMFALRNNPRYIPVVQDLAASADAFVAATPELTINNLAVFATSVAQRHGLADQEQAVFVGMALQLYNAVAAVAGVHVVLTADPIVKLYVTAFKDGCADAVMWAQLTPKK